MQKPTFYPIPDAAFAQLLIESDLSRPKSAPPSVPVSPIRFDKWIFPMIANMEDAPIMSSLFDVQTMASSDGPSIPLMSQEEADRRRKEELDAYTSCLAEGEILKEYAYGGMLAERGGYFIVHKDRPDVPLRYAATWLS